MEARSLFELVEAGARCVPADKPALRSADGERSYGEVIAAARGVGAALASAGIGPGDRVGLWAEKTPACVEALLGILAAGAAYVPVDPRSPPERARAIVGGCGLEALVVDEGHLAQLPHVLEGSDVQVFLVDGPIEEARALARSRIVLSLEAARVGAPADLPRAGPDDLAYVLCTSGSTGTPKGVVHTHDSGLDFVRWVDGRFGIRSDDVFSSHAPLHFDLSISDLFVALGRGATVRLLTHAEAMLAPYLARGLREWGITVWYSVPSILIAMMESGELERNVPEGLRLLFFAGEVFPTPQLRRLRRLLPHVTMANLFGPTETNVCTYHVVPPDLPDGDDAPIPIGRACENLDCFAIDDEGRTVTAPGVEGTLWVKGGNVTRGYLGDPVRTAELLKPDPRGFPGLACCTGDRVELRPDGDWAFRGRRDHQVKTRGYRVELGEIEAALAAHPAVREAVAVALPDPAIGNRIVAGVVLRVETNLDPRELYAFARQRLPVYMLPERIEVRAELPRTSTGKADRTALRAEWSEEER